MIKKIKNWYQTFRAKSRMKSYVEELKNPKNPINSLAIKPTAFCEFEDSTRSNTVMTLLELLSKVKTDLNPKYDKASKFHPHERLSSIDWEFKKAKHLD